MSFLDDLGDVIVEKIDDFTEAVEDKLEDIGDKAVDFLVSIAVNPYDVPNMFMPNYIVWQFSTAEKEEALVVSFSHKQDMKPIVAMIQGEIAKSGYAIELTEEDRRPDDLKQKYPLQKLIP